MSDFVMPAGVTELYLAFDPGHTTGFVIAGYDPAKNALYLLDINPLLLGKRYPSIEMESPPIVCFQDLYEEIVAKYDLVTGELVEGQVEAVHTACEDYTGGKGGNIQNTVNKIIGMIMATAFENAHRFEGVSNPKVYKNVSRLPYLQKVKELVDIPKYKGMSRHSKDALAHLFHRLEQEHTGSTRTITLV